MLTAAVMLTAAPGCTGISELSRETITLPPQTEPVTSQEVSSADTVTETVTATVPVYTFITDITEESTVPQSVPDLPDTADTADTYPAGFTFPEVTPPVTSAQTDAAPAAVTSSEIMWYNEYDGATAASTSAAEEKYYPASAYHALNYDIQHGMWISYLEYDSIMKNRTEEEFTASVCTMFDNVRTIGVNTVYVQVRAFGDAYYDSDIFPRGDRLTGDYDPLGIMISCAHDRGLSVHAWINPMRLMTDEQMKRLSSDCILKQWYDEALTSEAGYMFESGGRWYLDPGCEQASALICRGIEEILAKYDADGIQIDDYFYPAKDASLDLAWYRASGTELSQDDWRRGSVSRMVREMNMTVHRMEPTALFGISPAGNIENNYSELYADTETWCRDSSFCDYICPQLYYGFEHQYTPFESTAERWLALTRDSGVKTVIGLAAYKSGCDDPWAGTGSREWMEHSDILIRQVRFCEEHSCGTAIFRYDSLFGSELSAKELQELTVEN